MVPEARPAVHEGILKECQRCQGVVVDHRVVGVSREPWECLWVPLLDLPVSWVSKGVPWRRQEASEVQQKYEESERMVKSWQLRKREWGQNWVLG